MTTGVVVMAYGTPATPADVEASYTHIRRGRPPSADQLADLIRRYEALGGTSPMAERTRAQVRASSSTPATSSPSQPPGASAAGSTRNCPPTRPIAQAVA